MAMSLDTLAVRVLPKFRQCRIMLRIKPGGTAGTGSALVTTARKSAPEGARKRLLLSGESRKQPEEAVF